MKMNFQAKRKYFLKINSFSPIYKIVEIGYDKHVIKITINGGIPSE